MYKQIGWHETNCDSANTFISKYVKKKFYEAARNLVDEKWELKWYWDQRVHPEQYV